MSFFSIFYFLYLGLIFLSNIFAFDNLPNLSFHLVLFFPIFLYLILLIKKDKITFPKTGIYLLTFLLLSSISILFSVNKQDAFEGFLNYLSAFLIFIFSFNKKEELKKLIQSFLIIISIFSAAIFFLNWYFKLNFFQSPQSLLYPGYYHNQIADVLILGIILSFCNNSLFYILIFPFFIFTYSRTAYFSLIFTGTIYLLTQKFRVAKKYLLLTLILATGIIFLLIVKEFNGNFPKIKSYLTKTLKIPADKSFSGKRELHFSYAISIIKDNPLFGLGPSNFFYGVLKRQVNFGEGTATAHNIILDIFAENGIPAGIFFSAFIIFIFIKSKKNVYFYLFMSLTMIFMFDFGYLNDFLFLFWIILAALIVSDEKYIKINMVYFVLIILICGQLALFFPIEYKSSMFMANNYIIKNDKVKALIFYQKAIFGDPLLTAKLLTKIYSLQVELKGSESGRYEMEVYINNIKNIKNYKNSDLMKIIKSFCRDYKLKC